MLVQNLPSERKLTMGKVQKKVKKTNNSAFSATHTYIKLTLVSFFLLFFYAPFPNIDSKILRSMLLFNVHLISINCNPLISYVALGLCHRSANNQNPPDKVNFEKGPD